MTTNPTTDQQERARVRSRIGSLILEFCTERLKRREFDRTFFMEELRQFVEKGVEGFIAPDSPGRILRQLRHQRQLNYKVVYRRQSFYQVVPVEIPVEYDPLQQELFRERV